MYTIRTKDHSLAPAKFAVFVEITYHKDCGFKPDEKMISRVGAARDLESAKKLIADDRKAMSETYGGLIEPVKTKNRTYRVFRATAWEEVPL